MIEEKTEFLLVGAHLLARQMPAIFAHEGIATKTITPDQVKRTGCRNLPAIVWNTNNREALATALQLRLLGCRPHRYWIGGDVLRLVNSKPANRVALSVLNRILFASHTANSDWLATELRTCGIKSRPMPFSPVCCGSHWPMSEPPSPYTILFYSHKDNDHIYLPDQMLRAAANLPDCRFICVGDPELTSTLPNVEVAGTVSPEEMQEIYKKSHCLLRFTSHDGFPRMIFEAMAHGLEIVSNLPIPGITRAEDPGDIIPCISKLSESGTRRNLDLRNFVLDNFSAREWYRYWAEIQ